MTTARGPLRSTILAMFLAGAHSFGAARVASAKMASALGTVPQTAAVAVKSVAVQPQRDWARGDHRECENGQRDSQEPHIRQVQSMGQVKSSLAWRTRLAVLIVTAILGIVKAFPRGSEGNTWRI